MFTLLSPAKKLLNNAEPYPYTTTTPLLIDKTSVLAGLMKSKSADQIGALMDLSHDLSVLNYQRYQHFQLDNPSIESTYPALYIFQGDVYQGLQAKLWSAEDVSYAQSHLGILSGLYGLLKPLDKVQPYRLEMGVRLVNPKGANLYVFWRDVVTNTLNTILASQSNPVLLNLASTEYFKVVDEKKINCPIVTANFYEQKNNEIKMIGIFAKKARGMMARFIMQHRIDDLEGLKHFSESGYQFNPESSTSQHMDFVRVH